MDRIETDICVIGAGSGGLTVAAGAVQMGARVVLIEAGEMGGDCLNYGCIPSKALIAAAEQAHRMRHGRFGVTAGEVQVDFPAAKDHVRAVIEAIQPMDSQSRFEGLGCTVIRARARFVSETEVEAGGHRIKARRFVLATGSSPLVPDIPGLDGVEVLTNETIFDLRERPEHLLVVGGGPIGMEMAQAHRRLGCRVTVIEGSKGLPKDDPEAAAIVLDALRAEGVELVERAKVERVSGGPGQGVTVHTGAGDFTGSHLLMAVGRRVNLDTGLDAGGVTHSPKGIEVDRGLRSVSNRRVYAVGDAAGGMQFTHVAGYHGGLVVRAAALGLPVKAETRHIPWVSYTDPELAQVGLTEAQAREAHGGRLKVLRANFDESDRAVASGRQEGFVKVMAVNGRPVGATIVGAHAGELIAPWCMAIANKLKLTAFTSTVLPYPTLQEAGKRAAGSYYGPQLFENPWVKRAVRLVQRWGR
ncbi:dihydrolipoyl dehydrogenase family protein [Wenxinia marina]|uniref:Pyruvate/2-oxoglutarate dehydrogenase complex, dihydrolipoamide dehydrogenase (E3) component n=1 Tax=Wenxinia marina DSM 24838 TaxID=1123501 RepID=A0A0D0QA75_9RHOB|nr:FAD-dependent oxidoreductase [Wenxinia marina]KIQ69197.1 Pyruvate/2-oxoglutarate dehydrogenase complex, dihydrolipoamide dehydrogenase (E3) component [Wenxinia marina DSM 24838]GGL71094.1 dihydrolipoamide dehydrogenase [Wenxinia marina]